MKMDEKKLDEQKSNNIDVAEELKVGSDEAAGEEEGAKAALEAGSEASLEAGSEAAPEKRKRGWFKSMFSKEQ